MKKLITITALSLSIALLPLIAGCGSNIPNDPDSPEQSSSSDISNDISDTASDNSGNGSGPVIGNEITAMFETPGGDPVDLTNAVVKYFDGGEIPLSDMTADNWQSVTCEGVYLAEAGGVYYDNIINADIFDGSTYSFSGAPDVVYHEYKKYNVGDMFGSLKVAEASTMFNSAFAEMKPKYFYGGSVLFEGALTLTGKCWRSPETEGYDTERDIHFVPDAKSAKLLPIIEYYSDEDGNEFIVSGATDSFCYLAEQQDFYLGNADNYPNIDLNELPADGSCADVRVTLEKISFRTMKEWGRGFNCELVDLEIIQ